MLHKIVLVLTILLSTVWANKEEYSAEKEKLRDQIAKYENDIANLNKKIEQNRREAASEKTTHDTYRDNFDKEISRDSEELSKLESEYNEIQKSADSLSRVIAGKQYQIKEFSMKEATFKKALLQAIDTYSTALNEAPAPIVEKEKNSLLFLKNEITSGNVGNAEGLERLWQITQTVADDRNSVDVWSGRSTFDPIQGQVHYIRIGYAWLGCVNDDATKGAIWQFTEDQNGWKVLTDPAQLNAVRNAVKIRNGNKLPEIISLPVIYSAVTEATDEN